MNSDYSDIVNDPQKIRKHFIFCSTFILVYEYFISSWKQGIYFLYTYCKSDIESKSLLFHTDMHFTKIRYEAFEELKKKNKELTEIIKNDYHNLASNNEHKVKQYMFLWLYVYGFITESELETLEKCRVQRNIYAHEIDQSLKKMISQREKNLLNELIAIAVSASRKWTDKVKSTVPSLPEALRIIAEENNIEPPAFQTNTERFLSLTLENIKDYI